MLITAPQIMAANNTHVRNTTKLNKEHAVQKGINAFQSKDYSTAFKIFEPLAKNGNTSAQYYLGWMYFDGLGTPMDYEQAIKWFRKAAEQGDALAQLKLGMMYEQGQGTPKDYKIAASWVRKALEQNYEPAQIILSTYYYFGYGVHKDYVVAYSLCNPTFTTDIYDFNRAASLRSAISMRMTAAQIAASHQLTHEMQHYGVIRAIDAYMDSGVQ